MAVKLLVYLRTIPRSCNVVRIFSVCDRLNKSGLVNRAGSQRKIHLERPLTLPMYRKVQSLVFDLGE